MWSGKHKIVTKCPSITKHIDPVDIIVQNGRVKYVDMLKVSFLEHLGK